MRTRGGHCNDDRPFITWLEEKWTIQIQLKTECFVSFKKVPKHEMTIWNYIWWSATIVTERPKTEMWGHFHLRLLWTAIRSWNSHILKVFVGQERSCNRNTLNSQVVPKWEKLESDVKVCIESMHENNFEREMKRYAKRKKSEIIKFLLLFTLVKRK